MALLPQLKRFSTSRWLLWLQVAATLGILAASPSNAVALGSVLLLWALSTPHLTRDELVLWGGTCLVMSAMDVMAIRNGVFAFSSPDVLGLPFWEYPMWGYWAVHGKRVLRLEGQAPGGWPIGLFVILFAAAFPLSPTSEVLFISTSALLLAALARFHTREDLTVTGYFIGLGAVVESVGVGTDLWSYPGHTMLGFPLWFAPMWGGIGLIVHRLVLPLVRSRAIGDTVLRRLPELELP